MTFPAFDLWGSLRSFASDHQKPVHARWRQLKNLSLVIAHHPDPAPYWEYLKTVLVQEMGAPESAFQLLGTKLALNCQSKGPGLDWGQSDPVNRREEAWFDGPDAALSMREAKQGPTGWREEGRLADQGLNRGLAWSVVLVVSPPGRPESQFRLPLAAGFLDSEAAWGDPELVARWRGALHREERMVKSVLEVPEVREHVVGQGLFFYPDWDQEWAVLVFSSGRNAPSLLRGEESAVRVLYSGAQRYLWERRAGVGFPDYDSPFLEELRRRCLEYSPVARKWQGGGIARSMLMEHAFQSFIEKDRRGREGLTALARAKPLNWGDDFNQPFVTLLGASDLAR